MYDIAVMPVSTGLDSGNYRGLPEAASSDQGRSFADYLASLPESSSLRHLDAPGAGDDERPPVSPEKENVRSDTGSAVAKKESSGDAEDDEVPVVSFHSIPEWNEGGTPVILRREKSEEVNTEMSGKRYTGSKHHGEDKPSATEDAQMKVLVPNVSTGDAADAKAADTKAANAKAADAKAVDTKAEDTKAVDSKATDAKAAAIERSNEVKIHGTDSADDGKRSGIRAEERTTEKTGKKGEQDEAPEVMIPAFASLEDSRGKETVSGNDGAGYAKESDSADHEKEGRPGKAELAGTPKAAEAAEAADPARTSGAAAEPEERRTSGAGEEKEKRRIGGTERTSRETGGVGDPAAVREIVVNLSGDGETVSDDKPDGEFRELVARLESSMGTTAQRSGGGENLESATRTLAQRLNGSLGDNIVRQAQVIMKDAQQGEIRVIIRPPDLGRVRILLQMEDGHIAGRILVDNQNVRQVVEQNLAALQRAFQEAGLEMGDLEVSTGDARQDTGSDDRHAGGARGDGTDDRGSDQFGPNVKLRSEFDYGNRHINLVA